MSNQVFVPTTLVDFIVDLPQDPQAAAILRRQLVAACVFGGGGANGEWVSAPALQRGKECWPENYRARPARNVLSVLLELEQLGIVAGFEPVAGGYAVKGQEAAA